MLAQWKCSFGGIQDIEGKGVRDGLPLIALPSKAPANRRIARDFRNENLPSRNSPHPRSRTAYAPSNPSRQGRESTVFSISKPLAFATLSFSSGSIEQVL